MPNDCVVFNHHQSVPNRWLIFNCIVTDKGLHMSREIGWILGEIAEDEVKAGRPMLSAVAVSVKGKPGPGFFDLARQLGKLGEAKDEQAFWRSERAAAYAAWKRPLPK